MAKDEGIRPYGPGKFATILDSHAYGVTLDGGVDEEASYPEGDGWYGLIWLDDTVRDVVCTDAENADQALTEEEEDLLDESVAVIFFERSDGIVEVDWYMLPKEAEKAWSDIISDTEDDEDDEDEEEGD